MIVMDIIDLIDQAITPTCASCSRPLRPDGPSPDFCDELCQERWNNRCDAPTLMDRLTATGRANVAAAAPRLMVHRSAEGLLREMADYQRYTWTGPCLTHPLDTGAPWIRSPITPPPATRPVPATAVFIGGQRHGQTIGVPNPPRSTLEVFESLTPTWDLSDINLGQFERVTYRLVCHNGSHWYYVDPRPAAPQRTVRVPGRQPLIIDHHHYDLPRDAWWVTLTGSTHGVVCQVAGELLANDTAITTWFTERAQQLGYPVTDGSWEITEQRPPFRRDQ